MHLTDLGKSTGAYRLSKRYMMKLQRPELLFISLASTIIIVNVAHSGTSWLLLFFRYLTNPNPSPSYAPVHFITLTAVWASFFLCLGVCIRLPHLKVLRSVTLSASIPFGGTGLFEIVYQLIGRSAQPWAFHMTIFEWVMLIVWAGMGAVTIPFWRLTKDWVVLGAVTLTGFLIWYVVGFPQVTWGGFSQEPLAYCFNSSLKLGCLLIFLMPILHRYF